MQCTCKSSFRYVFNVEVRQDFTKSKGNYSELYIFYKDTNIAATQVNELSNLHFNLQTHGLIEFNFVQEVPLYDFNSAVAAVGG